MSDLKQIYVWCAGIPVLDQQVGGRGGRGGGGNLCRIYVGSKLDPSRISGSMDNVILQASPDAATLPPS